MCRIDSFQLSIWGSSSVLRTARIRESLRAYRSMISLVPSVLVELLNNLSWNEEEAKRLKVFFPKTNQIHEKKLNPGKLK